VGQRLLSGDWTVRCLQAHWPGRGGSRQGLPELERGVLGGVGWEVIEPAGRRRRGVGWPPGGLVPGPESEPASEPEPEPEPEPESEPESEPAGPPSEAATHWERSSGRLGLAVDFPCPRPGQQVEEMVLRPSLGLAGAELRCPQGGAPGCWELAASLHCLERSVPPVPEAVHPPGPPTDQVERKGWVEQLGWLQGRVEITTERRGPRLHRWKRDQPCPAGAGIPRQPWPRMLEKGSLWY
jgi:hypothetical protein